MNRICFQNIHWREKLLRSSSTSKRGRTEWLLILSSQELLRRRRRRLGRLRQEADAYGVFIGSLNFKFIFAHHSHHLDWHTSLKLMIIINGPAFPGYGGFSSGAGKMRLGRRRTRGKRSDKTWMRLYDKEAPFFCHLLPVPLPLFYQAIWIPALVPPKLFCTCITDSVSSHFRIIGKVSIQFVSERDHQSYCSCCHLLTIRQFNFLLLIVCSFCSRSSFCSSFSLPYSFSSISLPISTVSRHNISKLN